MSKTMRDVQWSFISTAISSLVHFLLRIVLGRELGASGLGLYTLIFTIYMFGTQFAGFGIGVALTKYIAEYSENIRKVNEFVSSGIASSFISGSMMGVLLYLFSNAIGIGFFRNPEMVYLLKIMALSFPFIALQKAVLGTLNGLQKMNYYAFLNIVQNVLIFLLSVVLAILFKMNVSGATFGLVVPTILVGLLSLVFIKDVYKTRLKLFNNYCLQEILKLGFYLVLISSVSMLNIQITTLLVGYFLNETEVGIYGVAVILVQSITLLPNAIQIVTTPKIAGFYAKKDYGSIRKLIKSTMLKTLLISLIFSVLLMIFGKYLIGILLTKEFLPSYIPILILLIGYMLSAPSLSIGGWYSSIGKAKLAFKFVACLTIINIVLNIILIPEFGIIGAAMAASTSLLISAFVDIIFLRKYLWSTTA